MANERNEMGQFVQRTYKVAVFDGRMFYNARHLYTYLTNYYSNIHEITYKDVAYTVAKKLKTVDKFFKVEFKEVSATMKKYLKYWARIDEGYEQMIAFETTTLDEFVIKYNDARMLTGIYPYYNMNRSEIILGYRPKALERIAKRYDKHEWESHYQYIINNSWIDETNGHHFYKMQISNIRQRVF